MRDLKCSLLSPVDLLPDACHHAARGHDEDALAPFSQWAGALILTQAFSADHQPSSGPTERILPSFFRQKMEDLVQSHTAPQRQSQKSAFLALDTESFALLDIIIPTHRLVGHKCRPVQESCGKCIVLDNMSVLIFLLFNTVTSWD